MCWWCLISPISWYLSHTRTHPYQVMIWIHAPLLLLTTDLGFLSLGNINIDRDDEGIRRWCHKWDRQTVSQSDCPVPTSLYIFIHCDSLRVRGYSAQLRLRLHLGESFGIWDNLLLRTFLIEILIKLKRSIFKLKAWSRFGWYIINAARQIWIGVVERACNYEILSIFFDEWIGHWA